ncbi:hypothetical protein RhiirC2_826684 [Rhizophagus irregularis]|uniref:Myb-like domain-containing protein n=1 Tax=Rhizophagus irregularis TaxID=588596 RepID=A0A2N1NDJ5_9GLOM|nr:hypothetical protein RhiirC2_826684 [Rhizophagus irregularis]
MATATSSIPNNPLLGVRSLLSILPEDLNLIEKSHWVGNKQQDAENTQEDPQKIEISMPPIKGTKRKKQVLKKEVKSNDDAKWTDSEIKILLEFWKENLEEWKRGKVKVYQKIISENVLPGRTLDQFRNKVGKLREMYLQKKS